MKHSESIANIAAALATFQAAHIGAAKNAQNPHLKNRYADLASVWDAIRGPLTENGLAVVQGPAIGEPGKLRLVTKLLHKSGEWLESEIDMPLAKQDPQGYGSALTYARRYALAAMLGVIQEDDDATAAMPRPQGGRDYRIEQALHNAEPVPAPKPTAKPQALANPAQIKALWATAKEACGDQAEPELRMYIEQLGLTSSKEMTVAQASEAIDTFKRIFAKKVADAG